MSKRKIYFDACEKFDTNFKEVFNFLSEDYQQKGNSYRFELLYDIYHKKFNLQEILKSFKYHNHYSENITFSISLSLFFFIKYIKAYHTTEPEDDVSINLLENQVRAKKISEEKLMDVIIKYFTSEKLSYSYIIIN